MNTRGTGRLIEVVEMLLLAPHPDLDMMLGQLVELPACSTMHNHPGVHTLPSQQTNSSENILSSVDRVDTELATE